MKDKVTIITPEAESGTGGVADHTLRLVEHLSRIGEISVIVPPITVDRLPAGAGKVLLQYSAYGFDRLGFPRELIRNLIEWKRKTHGRLVIMFHEIWTFWPITNKNFLVQLLHRRAIKQLLREADLVFTSTPDQVAHLRALRPKTSIQLLPVGSNIRPLATPDRARKPGTAVLFGLQSSRIRTLQRMQSSLRQLASCGRIEKLITVGSKSGDNEEEVKLLEELKFRDGFEQRGSQPEDVISQLLATASLALFGQSGSSLTKSGTFMAYAAHRLAVISESADPAKPEPFCLLTAPQELIEGISHPELEKRAERLRDWQERTSSWEIINREVAAALELRMPDRSPAEALKQ